MKLSFIAGSTAALLALVIQSAESNANPSQLQDVKVGTYKADPAHTQIVFSLSHLGFTEYTGIFSGASGTLRLDPKTLDTSKLDISIPVESITTTSSKLTEELKGEKWFNSAKFPSATFVSTNISHADNGSFNVTGNLTLHGVTKPVVLAVHFINAGPSPITKAYTVGFEASATIKRGDFGISMYLPVLGDDVKLSIAGAFETQG